MNALTSFTLVAEERIFRAAADRLGVTRSAVSQTIRRLENAMGVALAHRTTRSVGLTEAGERLHAEIAPSLADIRAAMEATRHLGASEADIYFIAMMTATALDAFTAAGMLLGG